MANKHAFTVEHLDPEINALIRSAMTKLLHRQLEKIEDLSNNPIKHQPTFQGVSTNNMGKALLEQISKFETAEANRERRLREIVSSVGEIKSHLVLKKETVEKTDPDDTKRENLLKAIDEIEAEDDEDDNV